jgi:hypothetical protein
MQIAHALFIYPWPIEKSKMMMDLTDFLYFTFIFL